MGVIAITRRQCITGIGFTYIQIEGLLLALNFPDGVPASHTKLVGILCPTRDTLLVALNTLELIQRRGGGWISSFYFVRQLYSQQMLKPPYYLHFLPVLLGLSPIEGRHASPPV